MWTTDKDLSDVLSTDDVSALMASRLAVKRDSRAQTTRDRRGASSVTSREALEGISRFLTYVSEWCDQDGNYDTDSVSVSRDMICEIRDCVESVIDSNGGAVAVDADCKDMYEHLNKRRRGCLDKHRRVVTDE